MKIKSIKQIKKATPKPKKLQNDEPVHLNMTFEQAIKLAVNTPIKKKNKN